MLTGKLVRLRAIEPSDAESLLRWHTDPELSRWMIADYPRSLAQIRKQFEERPPNTYDRLVLCIESLADGRALGTISLTGAEAESGRPNLAVYIGEQEFRGGGYGTDAVRVLCRYAFDSMRVHGVSLWVVPENTAARHVYEKLGFVEEGRKREAFRRDGKWYDMLLMSVLEGELKD